MRFTTLTAALAAAQLFTACAPAREPAAAPQPPRAAVTAGPLDAGPAPVPVVEVASPDAGPVDPLALADGAPELDHLARARALMSEGETAGALKEARRALAFAPTDQDIIITIAQLARRGGHRALEAAAWERLAEQRPDEAEPLVQQARALLAAREPVRAVQVARAAITVDADAVEAYQVVGRASLALGQLPRAIVAFEAAVDRAPGHGWARNNLGYALLLAGEDERALEALSAAAALLPMAAEVHNNLGVALERAGRTDDAKAAFQKAMDLNPRYVKARLNAARVARASLAPAELEIAPPVEPLPPQE